MADATVTTTTTGISGLHRIPPLKGVENYNVWRVQMEDILTDLDLYGYVNRTIPVPPETITVTETGQKDENGKDAPDKVTEIENLQHGPWFKADRKALSNIRLRVDGSVLTHIQSCEYSADAWDLLASTFQVKGTVGLIDLRRKFFSHRMTEGQDIEEHIQRMRGWFQQINDIAPGSCTEVDWITTLVASLPDSWDTFTQSIDFKFDVNNRNELANKVSDIRSRILAEAHRRNTRNTEGKTFFSTNKPSQTRFVRTQVNSRPADKSKSKCNNCGKIGHWAAECRGPGGGAYKHSRQNGPNRNFQNKRPEPNGKFRPKNGRANMAIANNNDQADYAFSARDKQSNITDPESVIWIADSGTTTHIVRDRSAFATYRESSGYISGVCGEEPIVGRGTVKLRCRINPDSSDDTLIVLTNVAHVPTTPMNLISLSLITEKGMLISLDHDQILIKDPNNRTIMVGAKLNDRTQGSLWQLDVETISEPKTNVEIVLTKQSGRTWLEWHKVLGHINAKALKRLKDTNAVNGMEIIKDDKGLDFECVTCMQSKAHIHPFPKDSHTQASEIGDLVVTDVWGPARKASIGHFKYYVSFTDVATRFTRLGFLKHKDETLEHYKIFEAMLNTQKNKKIKRVRFDNGGEFVNNEWKAHTEQNGTIIETTAPYSAQQNGIAERLNRTLTEKARAMLLESGAPKSLWSEAIAYACYLKNRVPTQVNGKFWRTPFEAFWGKKPDVSVLRPWGATCYVLNQGDNISKLDPKTTTGIFTGISDTQGKSWRYYKPGANRILHSRNITFPKIYANPTGESDETDWAETVVPPAEGEMTHTDSSAERKPEGAGIGGESVSNEKSSDSKGKGEMKGIKTEHTLDSTASKPTSLPTQQTHSKAVGSKSLNRSKLHMSPNPHTLNSIRQINAAVPSNPSGIRTRRGNPNQPAISMDKERGGVRVIIKDSATAGQSDSMAQKDSANFALELSDSSSDSENELMSIDGDEGNAYSLSSIDSPPTIPSDIDTPMADPPQLPSYNSIGELEEHFRALSVSDSFPTPPESTMAAAEDPYTDWALATRISAPGDNPTVAEALSGPDAAKWQAAMEEEVNTLEKMGTYQLVELPAGRKAMGNKWVLTIKRNELGEPIRYKARLVAQGFSQQPGIDFGQTFAPVVRLDSIRILASLANQNDWDIRQLDVHSAYLHAKVEEELYMKQIPHFEDGTSLVLRLNRSLYGLKQAGRMWNQMFDSKLKQLGYLPCATDTCVYHRIDIDAGKPRVSILANHVDDLVVITSRNNTESVLNELLHEFEMRDLGAIRHYLGISFTRNRLKDAYPALTPMSPSVQLTRYEGVKPKYDYGMYIVAHLAQFTSCFGPAHVTAVKHLIRYLKGTSSRGLTYRKSSDGFGEIGYSDADWGSNLLDRKSISGHVYMLGGAAVSWSAKKQATVALSTMEAEYIALSHACTQALWIRQFFDELGYIADAPTLILSDNLAALTLSVESQFHGRSKHIDIRHHFMRDIIQKGLVSTLYVPSKENLADAFTKALASPQFSYLTEMIMGEVILKIIDSDD
ncbi:Retrovirus-related Pol polyprotein from transposon TNT 1-94 [Ceratobasidium sp. AG-Ba]|nr:Retrovirus-related Pol polyprotein from transposon TNT 1-94 [Ceratobasidium sp. AG-Ba]